jgi:hypothetical protein
MHDIALLQLSDSVIFNPFIRWICLPTIQDFVRLGDRTVVTGWGETQGTGNFRYLREVEVPIQSNDQCGLKDISGATSLRAGLCTNSTCDACQVSFLLKKIKFRRKKNCFIERVIQVV